MKDLFGTVIGIDPGMTGGIAYAHKQSLKATKAVKMPHDFQEINRFIKEISGAQTRTLCILERIVMHPKAAQNPNHAEVEREGQHRRDYLVQPPESPIVFQRRRNPHPLLIVAKRADAVRQYPPGVTRRRLPRTAGVGCVQVDLGGQDATG